MAILSSVVPTLLLCLLAATFCKAYMVDDSLSQERVNFTGRGGRVRQWPIPSQKVFTKGDIYLGGLMMVHSYSEDKVCGRVVPQGGVQVLETMLFTIDKINTQDLIGDGIRLGSYIKDDCDRDTYGLDQAVDFIKASPKIMSGQVECRKRDDNIPTIVGVVGAPSSVTSIRLASLLKLFKIPQISYFSTASQLSNKNTYPYFLRTIPPEKYQITAIVDIIKTFGWSYVSILYEDSRYGMESYQELEQLLRDNKICTALAQTLPRVSKWMSREEYYAPIRRLAMHQSAFEGIGASGVVIFGSDQEVGNLMSAVRDLNYTEKFSWIGPDGWGARPLVYKDSTERTVEGAVTVQPLVKEVTGFRDYFLSLTPERNTRNPWFSEFWEDYFECRLPGATETPYNQGYEAECAPGLRMSAEDAKFQLEPQLQFVSDAVMAFAVALRNLRLKLCPNKTRSQCVENLAANGAQLLQELKTVQFKGLSGLDFQFTPFTLDGPVRYRILNFQKTSNASYQWVQIGRYQDRRLSIEPGRLRFRGGATDPPISACQPTCQRGAKRQINPGECRCWVCVKCSENAIVSRDQEQCIDCGNGQRPSADRSTCERDIGLEAVYDKTSPAAAALALASVGVQIACFALAVFAREFV